MTNAQQTAELIVRRWLRDRHLDRYLIEPPERDRLIGEFTAALQARDEEIARLRAALEACREYVILQDQAEIIDTALGRTL